MAGLTSYETLRRSILEQIGTDGIDATDHTAVLDVINRAVVGYQQDAARGAHTPMTNPGDVVERLRRSLARGGPADRVLQQPRAGVGDRRQGRHDHRHDRRRASTDRR